MNKRGLVLLTILTLVFGLGGGWYYKFAGKRSFKTLPGTYECTDFGLPDVSYNRIRIDEGFRVYGVNKVSDFPVGQLSPKNATQGTLEINMMVVHSPGFNFDPFTPMIIEGRWNDITVTGNGQKGMFTVTCKRWN